MKDFQRSIIQDRARDFIYRLCLAGKGQWSEIVREMDRAGFIDVVRSGEWGLRNLIQPMLDSGEIKRISRGQYVATCQHCHEPILNVMGMEH
jgi:hypothetical protein